MQAFIQCLITLPMMRDAKMKKNQLSQDQHSSLLVGQRIRKIRRDRGLTGQQLGRLLALSQQHVSRIENGSVRLNVDQLQQASLVLEVTLDELLLGVGYQSKVLVSPLSCATYHQASSVIFTA